MSNAIITSTLLALVAVIVANEEFHWGDFTIARAGSMQDRTSVKDRLIEIGRTPTRGYENFRIKQIALMGIALSMTLVLSLISRIPLVLFFIAIICEAIGIYFYTERQLTSRVKKYREQVEAEFPATLEMLVLAVAAGETPIGAIHRVSSRASGPLAEHLAVAVKEVSEGITFAAALDSLGARLRSVSVRRFIDATIISISRGAPLVEVLQSHLQEARAVQRSRVLGAAGKAEISMMIPVVFLILPISILFALWPSLSGLNLFAN